MQGYRVYQNCLLLNFDHRTKIQTFVLEPQFLSPPRANFVRLKVQEVNFFIFFLNSCSITITPLAFCTPSGEGMVYVKGGTPSVPPFTTSFPPFRLRFLYPVLTQSAERLTSGRGHLVRVNECEMAVHEVNWKATAGCSWGGSHFQRWVFPFKVEVDTELFSSFVGYLVIIGLSVCG